MADDDKIVPLYTEDQVRRLKGRDGRDAAEIEGILKAQWPLNDKAARADYVVDNRGPLRETRRRVQEIWTELQKISKSS